MRASCPAPTCSSTSSRAPPRATCASGRRSRRSSVPDVREVHNVRVMSVDGSYELSLHVKLPRNLSLADAHDAVEHLEEAIRRAVPQIATVHTHIEPLARTDWASTPGAGRGRHRRAGDRRGRAALHRPRRGRRALPRRRARPRRAHHGAAAGRPAAPERPPAGRRDRARGARAVPGSGDVIVHTEPEPRDQTGSAQINCGGDARPPRPARRSPCNPTGAGGMRSGRTRRRSPARRCGGAAQPVFKRSERRSAVCLV